EIGSVDQIFEEPLHPYTQALLDAIPVPDPDVHKGRVLLRGKVPSPENPPQGCRFHTRCPYKMEICTKTEPQLSDVGKLHKVACHLIS
ncbi:MAG: ABC transporter ATP-binding protein, partial [Candidatus Freyarchaeota archaeon]|nr:ABC transporter ATP-binding protein [Candidatus Jordarchaeia archaeon]